MKFSLRRTGYTTCALFLLALVGWFVVDFPILQIQLAIGFVVYGACLWRWPWLWLVAIPALLPIFDLAPWSGRFFFDEFDALVLLTVGVLGLRETGAEPLAPLPRKLLWAFALLIVSCLVSTGMRLWPPGPITVDSFSNYASPYNSLRVAKGFVWALALLRPYRQAVAQNRDAKRILGLGFLIGLMGVALVSLYERWLFPGLFAWNTDYRTTASFSSMHTGDGPIDIWLAMTMPFLGLLLFRRSWIRLLPLTVALALLASYALVVTQSRGPLIAVVLAYGVSLLALLATRSHRRRVGGAILLSLGAAILVAVVGLPVMAQTSLAQRFSQTREDALFRLGHWRNVLALRDHSLFAQVFGMGVGSFPAIHQERSVRESRATRYRYVLNGTDHFLTIWSGQSLYMAQNVTATQNSSYAFSAKIRTSEPHAELTVSWCELWMLTSANCTWNSFALHRLPGQWQTLAQTIYSKQVGSGRWIAGFFVKRPTRLTFFVSNAPQSGVDVSGLSLKDMGGHELLRNGDFSRGSDNWFWAVDRDLQWHTLNSTIDILFSQGWFGLFAVGSFLCITFVSLARQIAKRDSYSALFLASLTGFVINGTTVSTFDQPRLVLAFYLVCFATLRVDGAEPERALRKSQA